METDQVKKGAIKGTLRVKGQANRNAAPKCDLPAFCERCKKKTLGSLQLPCGRQVRLCEACSLEFYDILMAKISQNDSEFQAFLREQKRKEREQQAAKEKEQSMPLRASSRALLGVSNTPKRATGGRLAGPFEAGESLDGWKTTQDGRPGVERQKPKDIFIPVNRPHSSRDAIEMPTLSGKSAAGTPQRFQRGGPGRAPLVIETAGSPGNRRGSQLDMAGSPLSNQASPLAKTISPGSTLSPGTPSTRGGGNQVGQDINLGMVQSRCRQASFTRHGSGNSLGSSGSGSRGSNGIDRKSVV